MARSDLRISVVTWNVATMEPPPEDVLTDMVLIHIKESPDMYLIGFQEVSSKPHDFVQSAFLTDPWTDAISRQVCSKGYVLLTSVRLQGLVMLLYVRMLHLPYIHNIHTSYTKTGLRGVWGNKGAVSVRFDCYGRSMCFVNAHLAPTPEAWEDRDKSYYSIVASQEFPLPNTPHILYHDYILWFGDLNYRFEDLSAESIKFLSAPNKLHVLKEKDQLSLTMRGGRAFDQFNEGDIKFLPTYKYDFKQNTFDSSPKQRAPAWTDRILWRVNKVQSYHPLGTELSMQQLSYMSHGNVNWSDHKPVYSEFLIQVSDFPLLPLVAFDPIEFWRKGTDAFCIYTLAPETKTSSWDWIGLYKIGFETIHRSYCTYSWAVQVEEIHKPVTCRVKFGNGYIPDDYTAKYVLCYYSKIMNCVLGVSNVFRIVPEHSTKYRLSSQ